MVVNELEGEKIDVVQWSENLGHFVANALQPAKVKEVRIDAETGTALVIVPDYQLSLAIGKEGQNARLAARLTGLRIDIKSESQIAEDEAAARAARTAAQQRAPETSPLRPESTDTPSVDGEAPSTASAIAGEETDRQCAAVLSSGERCMNPAKPGSDYCGIPAHQKQARTA